jgi:hypothetical protein
MQHKDKALAIVCERRRGFNKLLLSGPILYPKTSPLDLLHAFLLQ